MTDELTEIELDAITWIWDEKGGVYAVDGDVPALVAALESARARNELLAESNIETAHRNAALLAELERERTQNREAIAEMDRRLDVLQRFADVWLKTGNDDEQLCMAHDFFVGVLNPPRAALSTQPEVCERYEVIDGREEFRCVLASGHEGRHRDKTGMEWDAPLSTQEESK